MLEQMSEPTSDELQKLILHSMKHHNIETNYSHSPLNLHFGSFLK